uniref:Uncharacterized protein n=1 Tax=Schistocephalus solidus TaxID=70667 RepID=A0A0X3P5B0_SCHSO
MPKEKGERSSHKTLKTIVTCLADSQPLDEVPASNAYMESTVERLLTEKQGLGGSDYKANFKADLGRFKPIKNEPIKRIKWKKVKQFKVVSKSQDCVFIVPKGKVYTVLKMQDAEVAQRLQALVYKENPKLYSNDDDRDKNTKDTNASVVSAKEDATTPKMTRMKITCNASQPKEPSRSHRPSVASYSHNGNHRPCALTTSRVAWNGYRPSGQRSDVYPRRAEYEHMWKRDLENLPRHKNNLPETWDGKDHPRFITPFRRAASQTRRPLNYRLRSQSPDVQFWPPSLSRYNCDFYDGPKRPISECSSSSSASSSSGYLRLGEIECTFRSGRHYKWDKPDIYFYHQRPRVIRDRTSYTEDTESDSSTYTPSDRTKRIMEMLEHSPGPKPWANRV